MVSSRGEQSRRWGTLREVRGSSARATLTPPTADYGLLPQLATTHTAYTLHSTLATPPRYGLQPTAYGLPPTAYCLRPTAYGLLPTAYGLLPTAYGLLPTAYCLRPTSGTLRETSRMCLSSGKVRPDAISSGVMQSTHATAACSRRGGGAW